MGKSLMQVLQEETYRGWLELNQALDGVSEGQAWAVARLEGSGDVYTGGCILGIIHHVATCKWVYGSFGFSDDGQGWRWCADRLDAAGPSLATALRLLAEAHEYWLGCCADLSEARLGGTTKCPGGDEVLTVRQIQAMLHHDIYHAGQINLLRAMLPPASNPPPSYADEIRRECRDSPAW